VQERAYDSRRGSALVETLRSRPKSGENVTSMAADTDMASDTSRIIAGDNNIIRTADMITSRDALR